MVKRQGKPTAARKTALCAALMMLSVIGFTMLLFAFGIPMSAYNAVVPIAGIAIYAFLFDRGLLKALFVNLALLIIWSIICSRFFDWSYDGMYYHKEAIITLAEGWNPLYESCKAAQPLNGNADLALWLDNYPKGIWICSAAVYIVTGFLETAKAVNILFIIILFCSAYSAFRTVFNSGVRRSLFFSCLVCLNPVFISQIFTSYNDLAVGALVIEAAFLGMKIYSSRADNYDYALLFCCAALSCLVKFTAPLLFGIVLIAYGAAFVIKRRGENIAALIKKPAAVILSGFIIGTALFGFDPYIKHLADGKNLVYPVLGEDKYDIMNTNPPEGIAKKPQPVKYFLALASETNNDKEQHYKLKIPFTVHSGELSYLSHADTRLGGFGLWFSGILLLAAAAAAFVRFYLKKKMRPEIAALLTVFLLLGLFFPEAWWARYASYTYYIPLFLIFYAASAKGIRPAAYAVGLFLAANSIVNIICVINDGSSITADINAALDDIKSQNRRIEVRINDFPSHLKLFEEKGIVYTVAPDSIPDEILFYSDTKFRYLD